MVRVSLVHLRTPVIRFRAGGGGARPAPVAAPAAAPAAAAPVAAAPAAPAAAPVAAAAPPQVQQTAPMSTAAISDIDLPLRYRRQPLTEEEIDHINGGGAV